MKEISTTDVLAKINAGEALHIIDVRTPQEVAEGHITGVDNIPLHVLEAKLPDLTKQTPYILVCRSSARSGQATQFLTDRGYDATNMVGGMLAWEGPVATGYANELL